MSLGDTLQFLRLRGNGYTTNELIQGGLEPLNAELNEQHRVARVFLDALQTQSEAQISDLMGHVIQVDVTQPGRDRIQALEKQLEELQETAPQLQGILGEKEAVVKERQQIVLKLKGELPILKKLLKDERPSGEAFLIEAGRGTCYMIARTKDTNE